jgi:hypothetical protein
LYTKYVFKHKKDSYKFDYDYPSLSGMVDDGIAFGVQTVSHVLDKDIDEQLFEKSFLNK